MNELKPCPFCGGEADFVQDRMMGSYMAVCKKCHAHSAFQVRFNNFTVEESKQRAIEAWNRRTSEWIPCNERLPETEDEVLVTVSGKHGSLTFENAIQMGFYNKEDGWYICEFMEWMNPEVTAWMSLPEPYKSEVE